MGLTAAGAAPALGFATQAAATPQAAAGTSQAAAKAAADSSLVFDPAAYTEQTVSVTDTAGAAHSVTYRFYKVASYVANPVDTAYQSLNVSVPVSVDGTAVDATNAPILFANQVGGYMPSSVANATGIGGAMGPAGTLSRQQLALAAGYVVVEPGARGRSLVDASGTYYGVAPAAIVDLKAAVRYLKFNKGRVPGDTERIVTSGVSAGGALSALLGASGDSPLYDSYLAEIGAADASDAIFASGDWCPITDLEHADAAYEWNWGANALASGAAVDATVSGELKAQYTDYIASLKLRARGYGALSVRNLDTYILETFIQPSATKYLAALSDTARATYLAANPFITWSAGQAAFTWADFLAHVGARKKNAPSFDAFDLSTGENNLYGAGATKARHFTLYALRHEAGASARLDADIPAKLHLMNPMYHLVDKVNPHRAKHWWIRVGTKDSDTSLSVVANLATRLTNLGDDVDTSYYWDAGHGADLDPGDFITWIGKVTGYQKARK
ncbi:Tat pathway signal protein [Streptomyces sp. NBC_01275]|uniref:subtype B tannase n=1 Tax=Streptomyces sp. NBC_01275 TaxID=2903807 RepID=UPI002254F5F8|nr:subtype B tannase [Streptomyces sp. NBC_01275]MCX4763057.1 Tat pathway signal protein [Streptomyces sp. NBC_01275]